jgi:phage N-6-adenine-methyltransferase
MSAVMFSSDTAEWATPQTIVDALAGMYGAFTLDACATPDNAKAARYYTKETDGLSRSWAGETVWMNPPYGREIGRWVAKAYTESQVAGAQVVCLIPARTDTRYWHDYVMRAREILFIRGRIRFGDAPASAPFPSAVVLFNGGNGLPTISSWIPKSDAMIQAEFDLWEEVS